eukprot:314059-Pyramimonas_sp.AAC.1
MSAGSAEGVRRGSRDVRRGCGGGVERVRRGIYLQDAHEQRGPLLPLVARRVGLVVAEQAGPHLQPHAPLAGGYLVPEHEPQGGRRELRRQQAGRLLR